MHLIERRAVRFATVVLATLTLVLAAGCGTIGAFVDLQDDLQNAGFSDVNVNVDCDSGGDVLRIEATGPPGDTPEEAQRKAAEIAWTTFPRRFELLRLDIGGQSVTLDRAQLEQEFGPRDPDLDDKAARGRHPQPRHRPAHRAGRRVRALRRPHHPDHRAGAALREEEAGPATAAVGRPEDPAGRATASRSTPSSTASRSSTANPSTRSSSRRPPQQQPPGWGPPPGQQPPPPPSQ